MMNKDFRSDRMFDRVAAYLRKRVQEELHPGDKLPGIKELSRELGVSEWTLRSAEAMLAHEGVLDVIHGSGVFVAQPAKAGMVGIYTNLDVLQPRTSSFHVQVLRNLRMWLEERGVRAEVYVGNSEVGQDLPPRDAARFFEDVREGRLGGVALFSVPGIQEWVNWVRKLTIPCVGALTPYLPRTDYAFMVREGVRRLRAQGSERIALMAWGEQSLRDSFGAVLAEEGLELRPEWVKGDLNPMLAGAGWEEFREIWGASREKPDGLLVGDDLLFQEACLAIHELQLAVPGRLRIVTHANAGAQVRYPFPVTVFELDPMEEAEILGAMLLDLMRGEPVQRPSDPLSMRVREVRSTGATDPLLRGQRQTQEIV